MIFHRTRDNWEAPEPYRLAWLVPLALAVVLLAIALSACEAAPPPAISQEPGFAAFCAAQPEHGTCP